MTKSNISSLLTDEKFYPTKLMTDENFQPTKCISKTRFSDRPWEEYVDNNDKKVIFVFVSWLYSCFHIKQSTKTKTVTKVFVCFRRKDFLLLCRHHLKFDHLSYPCSIKAFDYGIVLFPKMVIRVYDPLSVKKSQITQFKGHFYITRRDPIWQLFAHFTSISCVELVWNKFFCCLIYAYMQGLKAEDYW